MSFTYSEADSKDEFSLGSAWKQLDVSRQKFTTKTHKQQAMNEANVKMF